MNDELSNKIIGRIDAEQIKPLPRWRFILLRVIFWLFTLLSVIIGSLAVGAILFLFFDYHGHGLATIPNDLFELLLLIPYIWLMVFALFLITANISIKHTKRGYQYSLHNIILVSVSLSVIFGSILNVVGVGRITHEFLNNNVPVYNYAVYDSRDAWNRPAVGRLAGIVSSIQDNKNFSVIDFNGRLWHVRLASSTDDFFLESSSTVRISGFLEPSSGLFIARSIIEWER
jgi:hypothetical protein